jgi:hypothetical protein
MTYILSIDPGLISGVSLLEWSDSQDDLPKKIFSSEVDPDGFAQAVEAAFISWKSYNRFYVVCERFVITAQTVRNSQAPYSLEQIGVIKHLCRVNGYNPGEISMQAPVDAKSMFPNDALKKIGVWHKGGEGHANDSIRHSLLKLTKIGWKPRILLE